MQDYDDTNINRIEVEKAISKTDKFYSNQILLNSAFGLLYLPESRILHPLEYKDYFEWTAQYD